MSTIDRTPVDPDVPDDLERQAQVARALIARTSGRDPEANIEARRSYAALRAEIAITKAVSNASPLSESQRSRLRALLNTAAAK